MKTHLQTQLNRVLTEYNRYTSSQSCTSQDAREVKLQELMSKHLWGDQIQTRNDQKRKPVKKEKVDPSMMRRFKAKVRKDENQKPR